VEPFTVQCSSCHSRIRVRNPSLIGQLVNCPKCGSMVLIPAPQQILVDSPGGSNTDSMSLTKDALPTPETDWLLPQAPDDLQPASQIPLPPPPPNEAFDLIPPGAWTPEPAATPIVESTPSAVAPSSASRQMLLVACLGLCSLLIAGGVFFLFLRSFGNGPTVAVNPPAAPQPIAAPDNNLAAPAVVDTTSPAGPEVSPAGSADPAAREPIASESALATEPKNTTAVPANESRPGDPPTAMQSGGLSAGGNSLPAAGPPLNTTALPSAIFPAGEVAPSPVTAAPDNPPTEGAAEVKRVLPPGLQNFASLFDQALVPVLADAAVPLAAAPETNDGPAATDDTPDGTSPVTFNLPDVLDQRLAIQVTGLLIQDRPLSEVLSTLSQAGDLPFVCDIDALRAGGINPQLPIQFKSTSPLSLSEILAQLSTDYQLSFEPFEKKLIVVRCAPALLEQRIPLALAVGDLLAKVEDGPALLSAIENLLPEVAGALQLQGDQVLVDYTKVDRIMGFQIMRLLATWRAARQSAKPTSTTGAASLELLPPWPLSAPLARAAQKSSQSLTPESLAQTWQRLTAEATLDCWIDWPNLSGAQIAPGQTVVTLTYDRSLQDILQAHANKYHVVFAMEDDHSLWVTTPEMHRAQPRLYLLPLNEKTREQWQAELQGLTPVNADGSAALRMVATPDDQFLFVRCCRPTLAEPNQ